MAGKLPPGMKLPNIDMSKLPNVDFSKIPNIDVGALNMGNPHVAAALSADTAAGAKQLYHYSSYALAGLAPVAVLRPNLPTDLLLNAVIPVHSHIAMNYIIADYVPKTLQGPARLGMLGVTGITALGMLKLNLWNGGVTKTVMRLWGSGDKK